MKRIILAIAILVLASSPKKSEAQGSNDVAFNYLPSSSAGTEYDNINFTEISDVHVKAVRNFARTHKTAADVKWLKTNKGFAASFSSEGKNTKIVYDDKGRWQYDIISYTEVHLDSRVRDLVKSRYFDNAIIGIQQFEFENKTVYVVKMLDQQSTPLTLKVCDGQIEDITSHAKK